MAKEYEALCGISEEELYSVFAEPIRELAAKYKVDEAEMKQMLKQHYDGYHFSDNLLDIYNPFSLLNCFKQQQMRDFWFASGTPTYLVRLLNHFKQNINELISCPYPPEAFVDYKADVEQPLPMIYQSGYLTIKSVNPRRNTYWLDFPQQGGAEWLHLRFGQRLLQAGSLSRLLGRRHSGCFRGRRYRINREYASGFVWLASGATYPTG